MTTTTTLSLTQARDKAIETLQDAVANDQIELEVFEQKMDAVMAARDHKAIGEVVEGLSSSSTALAEVRSSFDLAVEPVAMSAIFGGVTRRPQGVVPRTMTAKALFGGVVLDLRDARFQPGITIVKCRAVFGGVEVLVPPGVRLEMAGSGIFGGFDESPGDAGPDIDAATIVRVTGKAIFGGVSAKKKRREKA